MLVSGGDAIESRWAVTPDGQVEFDKEGTTGTATLSAADLSTLEELLDEDQLRVALRDGIECSSIPFDGAGYRILLVSDGQTFERVVSDCVIGPEGNVFQRLIDLVTAYPKGEWDRLQISIQSVVPCPPDELCGEIRTITPNGELQINENGVIRTASLNQQDLTQLEQLIPELRVALRDGIACDTQLDGASHSVLLEIDGQTLERDVTDCILEPEENVIQRLYDLVTMY